MTNENTALCFEELNNKVSDFKAVLQSRAAEEEVDCGRILKEIGDEVNLPFEEDKLPDKTDIPKAIV